MMKRRTILNKSISLLLALMLVFTFASAALAADDNTAEPDTSCLLYTSTACKNDHPNSEYMAKATDFARWTYVYDIVVKTHFMS